MICVKVHSCCMNFHSCSDCFDSTVLQAMNPPTTIGQASQYEGIELPTHSADFAVHSRVRCAACLVMPIIGEMFECCECDDITLCRKCFFQEKEPKQHGVSHEMQLFLESSREHINKKCSLCKNTDGAIFICQQCANLILCKSCHTIACSSNDTLCTVAPAHKSYHKFTNV